MPANDRLRAAFIKASSQHTWSGVNHTLPKHGYHFEVRRKNPHGIVCFVDLDPIWTGRNRNDLPRRRFDIYTPVARGPTLADAVQHLGPECFPNVVGRWRWPVSGICHRDNFIGFEPDNETIVIDENRILIINCGEGRGS